MTDSLWHAENEYLAVDWYADASADLLDRVTGARWRMGRMALQEEGPVDVGHVWLRTARTQPEQFPGRFRGHRQGDALRFTLLGRERRDIGALTVRPRLDGEWLEVRIAEVDERLPSLAFPPPIESASLVLPSTIGRWIRQSLPAGDRRAWVYPLHLNMRWFGGLDAKADGGWIGIADEGYADWGLLAADLAAWPLWLKSLGRWPASRTLRYRFTRGGYVGLAKAFRAYAVAKGLHRPLKEKVQAAPFVGNLLGGRSLSCMQAMSFHPERAEDRLTPRGEWPAPGPNPRVYVSHADARRLCAEARAAGMQRGLIVLRGWIRGGYDESHPDIWPPEPALGSREDLRQALAVADPFLAGLHDNYQDMYLTAPSWPKGVSRRPGGDPNPAGFWAGGQAYLINARDGLAYAKRNWEHIRTLAPRAMFIDTTTAMQWYESHEPGNPLTRAQDGELKEALLRFYKEQGVALGSEEGADFGMPWLDWIENRHRRVAGESVPLWPLVYHDAAFCYRYNVARPPGEPRWLADLLWGYALMWACGGRGSERAALPPDFGAADFVDAWHGRIGLDEMLSHRYLTDDCEVEETTFASGAAIVVNFAAEPRTVEGVTVPARGYVVRAC